MVRIKKKILILIFIIISSFSIIFTISYLSFFSLVDGDGYVPVVITTRDDIGTPILNPITPEVDNDGSINLKWSLSSSYLINSFQVWRSDPYGWFLKHELGNIHQFTAICNFDAIYEYKVRARALIDGVQYYSPFSNIQSVIVDMVEDEEEEEEPLPLNPSIIINYGAETTNSFEITLTLSCENADQMNIHISEGIWTGWVSYRTTYAIILFEDDPKNPDYTVGVIFKNDVGESGEVYDDITYEPPSNPLTGEYININYGAETTNSCTVVLELYCNFAEEMCFKLSSDSDWTTWEPYSITKIIILPENSVDNPDYIVGVKYKKDNWETEPVYDSITVDINGNDGDGDGDNEPAHKPTNYTLVYILIGIFGGLVGIGILLKYRNQIIKSK